MQTTTAAASPKPMTRPYQPTAREQQLLGLRAQGFSVPQIGRIAGIAENSVSVAFSRLRKKGVDVGSSTAATGRPPAGDVEIPPWVKAHLRDGYRAIAAEEGEEAAASWARRAKETVPPETSSREKQMLDLRAAGHSIAATASRVAVSPGAVKKADQRLRERGVEVPAPADPTWAWTEDRIETLRKLFADGLSASQIAAELGAPSRNTVIGKVNRLGLKCDPKPKPVMTAKPAAPAATTLAAASEAVEPPYKDPTPPTAPAPQRRSEPSPAGGLTIDELRLSSCRWPLGDPRDDSFRFCGSTRADPYDDRCWYCAKHKAMAAPEKSGRGR